jgi:hypothetical protein
VNLGELRQWVHGQRIAYLVAGGEVLPITWDEYSDATIPPRAHVVLSAFQAQRLATVQRLELERWAAEAWS